MMYFILDQVTVERMHAARPMVSAMRVDFVPAMVRVLAELSTEDRREIGIGKCPYWRASLAEITEKLNTQEWNIKNRHIGFAATGLGLEKMRRSDGYYIFWSQEQLTILLAYYGIEV